MEIRESVVVAAAPDAVWAIAGDPYTIADWLPALESTRRDGDLRHATFAGGGGDATERIVEHDDAHRTYVYDYVDGPLALQEYRSRIAVTEHPDGSEVVWQASFRAGSPEEEQELHDAIAGIYRDGLAELARRATGADR